VGLIPGLLSIKMMGFTHLASLIPPLLVPRRTINKVYAVLLNIMLIILRKSTCYTKTGLVFGFSKNQILVAVILGQNCFWISSENNFEMGIKSL
jgi:hypothetical protein